MAVAIEVLPTGDDGQCNRHPQDDFFPETTGGSDVERPVD